MGHQTGESLVPVAIGIFIDRAVDERRLLGAAAQRSSSMAVVFAGLSNSWRFGAKLLLRAAKGTEHDLRVAVARRVLDPGRRRRCQPAARRAPEHRHR